MSGRRNLFSARTIAILACSVSSVGSAIRPAAAQAPAALGQAPYSRMHALLEKTFLNIDVLRVHLCFDDATAFEFARIAGAGRLQGTLADSISRVALRSEQALGLVEFVRNVSLDQFLDGIDGDQRNAVERGFMDDSVHQALREALPEWFAFLETGGIRKGDRIRYEFEPNAVRTTFIDQSHGSVLLDRRDGGRARRNSVLATWLAPGSPFRSGLLRSLEGEGAAAAGVCPVR